jgi:hypothetical protein
MRLIVSSCFAAAVVGLLSCGCAFAADTYQTNLGPMPLDEAVKKNMLGRGDATATLDGKDLTVAGTFAGLTSPATAAHLIVGTALGVPGTESLDLTVTQGVSGTISGPLTGNLWGWLLPQHEDAAPDVPQQGPWFLPQLSTPTR